MIREPILFRPFFSLLLLLSFSPFCTYEPTSQKHPSDGKNGWNSALDELRKEYSIRDDRTIQALYQAFDSLNLNPIPLRNDSTFESLPFILDMIQQAISKS